MDERNAGAGRTMSKLIQSIVVVLATFALGACSQLAGPRQIEVSSGITFDLLPPQSWGGNLVMTQLAEIDFSGEQQEMIFVTEISATMITMVGLMSNGTRLFSLQYDGENITSDGYQPLLRHMQPAYLLAEFQLSQWPLELIVERLLVSSTCVATGTCTLTETDDQLQRVLRQGGRDVVTISYGGVPRLENSITLSNPTRGYTIHLTTLEVEQF